MTTGNPELDLALIKMLGTAIGDGIRYPIDATFMFAGMPYLSGIVFPGLAHFLRWFWVWS